jgi:hypothetical protein
MVIVRSEERGTLVFGNGGVRELHEGRLAEGDVDPLAQFEPHTGDFLDELAQFEQSGDIIVNGAYDPSTGWVIGFDDLVGAHGGVGGMQTQPFIAYPSAWTDDPPDIIGSVGVHKFLQEHTSGTTAAEAEASTTVAGEPPVPASPLS